MAGNVCAKMTTWAHYLWDVDHTILALFATNEGASVVASRQASHALLLAYYHPMKLSGVALVGTCMNTIVKLLPAWYVTSSVGCVEKKIFGFLDNNLLPSMSGAPKFDRISYVSISSKQNEYFRPHLNWASCIGVANNIHAMACSTILASYQISTANDHLG